MIIGTRMIPIGVYLIIQLVYIVGWEKQKEEFVGEIQHTVDFIDGGNYNPYFIEPYKTMHAENTKYMKDRYDKASYALY